MTEVNSSQDTIPAVVLKSNPPPCARVIVRELSPEHLCEKVQAQSQRRLLPLLNGEQLALASPTRRSAAARVGGPLTWAH
jgi:hypothetical protein